MSSDPGENEVAADSGRRRAPVSPAVVRPLRLGTAERLLPPQSPSPAPLYPMIWAATVLSAALIASTLLWRGSGDEATIPVTARSEVLAIEQMLASLAIPPGTVDGIADDATAAAVREFQHLAGLPEDGLATPALLEELRAITSAE